MRLVVDTNVLVSGLLSPHGGPGTIVGLIVAGRVRLCADGRILAEYTDVLRRPKFSFPEETISALLELVRSSAELISSAPLPIRLPDPDDEPFLEVALAAMADYLVTGNTNHFPSDLCLGVQVLTPRSFVDSAFRAGIANHEDGAGGGT